MMLFEYTIYLRKYTWRITNLSSRSIKSKRWQEGILQIANVHRTNLSANFFFDEVIRMLFTFKRSIMMLFSDIVVSRIGFIFPIPNLRETICKSTIKSKTIPFGTCAREVTTSVYTFPTADFENLIPTLRE